VLEFDLLGYGGRIFSGLVLIPYFGWGIYTLRARFLYHEDISPTVEFITLVTVAIFLAIETYMLRAFASSSQIFLIFAILGLFVSGTALYGPMAASLLSQAVVDAIIPDEPSKTHEPRYAPAEALEREGDYEGALREYLVIARIFPTEPTVHIRIAETHMTLSNPSEAAPWFQRALKHMKSADAALQVTNRLCEIYTRQLSRPDDARRVLEEYLEKYSDAEFADIVRERLARSAPSE
jgi:tetratricopeptide (TPR) repeat protein